MEHNCWTLTTVIHLYVLLFHSLPTCDAGEMLYSRPASPERWGQEEDPPPATPNVKEDPPIEVVATANTGDDRPPGGRLSPIVFIPGTGGSQLEARMNKAHIPPPGCSREKGWFRLWLNVMYMFTGDMRCWVDAMKLRYNSTAKTSSNAHGLEVRVPSFGVTDSVEYIDPSWTAWVVGNVGMYAAPLIDKLQEWGYVRNLNVRGAPYDFRFAPHSLREYYRSLRRLVEDTYNANGGTRVSIVAHSMGGLVALYFLNHQPQAWKNHYVHRFISLNTPWKGTVMIAKALASGINFGSDNIDPWIIRDQQRSQESSAMLIPSPSAWSQREAIVTTPQRNYTARDLYNVFFDDIGYPIGKEKARNIQNRDYQQHNPGVKMLCLYTHGVPTPDRFVYRKGFKAEKGPTRTVMGRGDGTVNYRSLRGCRDMIISRWWRSHQNSVYLRGFKGPNHDGIFTDERVHSLLKKALYHP